MKVIKPSRLGLIHRVVEHGGVCNLVVTVLTWLPFDNPKHLITEQAMWIAIGEHVPSGVIDEGLPKPRGEVLVTGSAFAIGGPAAAVMARLSLGEHIQKEVAVFGNRYWLNDKMSEPVPFETMPVDWAHAFGGAKFLQNPLGMGIDEVESEAGRVVPVPNVENPKELILGPRDRPTPAGFGAYEVSWPQRFSKMGTYDARYLETRFPGPAEDFDAAFYNVAPEDQWMPDVFSGTEEYTLEGMHPTKAKVGGELEKLIVKAFVTQRGPDGDEHFHAIRTRVDTLHFFPSIERVCVVYRGTHRVSEDDADDIVHLVVAAESPDHPKTIDHYRAVLAKRLDKDTAALASFMDEDLMPPKAEGWEASVDAGELGEWLRQEQPGLAAMQRGRKRAMEEARDKMVAAGFDPDVDGPNIEDPAEPMPDPYDFEGLAEYAAKMEKEAAAAQEEAKVRQREAEEQARAAYAAEGLDFDAERSRVEGEIGKPPTFSAADFIGMLHDMSRISHEGGVPNESLDESLVDPRFEEALIELEGRARDAYRMQATFTPPTTPLADEAQQMLRVEVTAAKDAGVSLAKRDLTGADLSGMDLSGVDLSDAFLADANLSGARLLGADLSRAVLARADLTGADLSGANLDDTSLGAAKLVNTRFNDASMNETMFMRATLDGTVFVGARIKKANFLQVAVLGADFSHVDAEHIMFLDTDLSRASFAGARLHQCGFLQCDVHGVDFTGCDLTQAQFLTAQADDCCFAGADLTRAVCVHETSMARCVFTEAKLLSTNFRKTPLTASNFERATMPGADLSACDLRGANLRLIQAQGSMWMRSDLEGADMRGADLLNAILSKARLQGTDLRGANLSRADLSRVRLDGNTKIDDALLLDARVHPKHEGSAQL